MIKAQRNMAELKPYRGNYYLWDYLPSTPAAVIFVVLFAGATGFVGWRMAKTRTWFSIPFVLGGLCKSTPQHQHEMAFKGTCTYILTQYSVPQSSS